MFAINPYYIIWKSVFSYKQFFYFYSTSLTRVTHRKSSNSKEMSVAQSVKIKHSHFFNSFLIESFFTPQPEKTFEKTHTRKD